MPDVFFVSTNELKFKVAQKILSRHGIRFVFKKERYDELQVSSLEEVVRAALGRIDVSPVAIEDSGLFIRALGGFPGPYSSYVQKTIGCEGILRLMEGVEDRHAEFRSVVGFKGKGIKLFKGKVEGEITKKKHVKRGHGYDFIFRPKGSRKTFSEMDFYEMIRNSDWGVSFEKLGMWLKHNL